MATHPVRKRFPGKFLVTLCLWNYEYYNFVYCTLYRLIRAQKARKIKMKKMTESWMEISQFAYWGIHGNQRRGMFIHLLFSLGTFLVSRKGQYKRRNFHRNLFINLKKSWEFIILLQDGHKELVCLCFNDSICGFPPTVFSLQGLSRLLVIIANKSLLWIMVITVPFKDPSHNHCGKQCECSKDQGFATAHGNLVRETE